MPNGAARYWCENEHRDCIGRKCPESDANAKNRAENREDMSAHVKTEHEQFVEKALLTIAQANQKLIEQNNEIIKELQLINQNITVQVH